ncbi:MAG: hypothetical protein AAGB12_13230 [Pseudomonadota bacterium]
MSLAYNLQLAEDAIRHVASLNIISSNKISHRIRAAGGIDNVIGSDQGAVNPGPAGQGVADLRNFNSNNVRMIAGRSALSGFGNCGELAMIAAIHMMDAQGTPIHLMWFEHQDYDHMWATIGVQDEWDTGNLRSWGNEAVWVDPWQTDEGIAFSLSDFIAGRVRNLNASYLCDSVDRIEAGDVNGIRIH